MGAGSDDLARKLLGRIEKRAIKIGFRKAMKKASILLSQL